jgi:hypothetical protein
MKTNPPKIPCLAALLLAGLLAAPGLSRSEQVEVGGVAFASSYSLGNEDLRLVGAGVLRWKLLFRAYASAFYLPAEVPPGDWPTDVAKCLTIHYFWDIPREKFGPAGIAVLERMYPPEQLEVMREPLQRIDQAYVDIQEGDRYTLSYIPGQGTTLLHNGQHLVTIPGTEFARLYFSIWLGSDPVDSGLRDRLLGGES